MLKLQERKITTKQGLEELQNFLKSFNFSEDIKYVESEITFFARLDVETEGQRCIYLNCNCYFYITNGNLKISCTELETKHSFFVPFDTLIKRISFFDCLASFTSVVTKYNYEVVKKESEIEKFLNFMQEWKNK